MRPQLFLDLLDRALTEEIGLVVTTNNPKQLSDRLLETKKDQDQYAGLEICIPSTPNTVMIVKKSVDLEEPDYGDVTDV